MQALYQAEQSGNEIGQVITNLLAEEKYIPKTQTFARHFGPAAWADHQAADKIIESMSADWPLSGSAKLTSAFSVWLFMSSRKGVPRPRW